MLLDAVVTKNGKRVIYDPATHAFIVVNDPTNTAVAKTAYVGKHAATTKQTVSLKNKKTVAAVSKTTTKATADNQATTKTPKLEKTNQKELIQTGEAQTPELSVLGALLLALAGFFGFGQLNKKRKEN
jgi:LPXTG-motif cell wall-anchored protein